MAQERETIKLVYRYQWVCTRRSRVRMSPISAINFILLSCALLLLNRRPAVSQILAIAAISLVAVSVIGYAFDFRIFYAATSYTALAFLVCVAGRPVRPNEQRSFPVGSIL